MFFDEVKLSKKSWHYKLMKFTWGQNTPNLWSFCPYFWLTIFNFFILPITLVIRSFQGFINFLDRKLYLEPYERFVKEKSEDPLFIGAIMEYDYSEKKLPSRSMFKKRDRWSFIEDLENMLLTKWDIDYKYSEEYREKQREIYEKYWDYKAKKRQTNAEIESRKNAEREMKRLEHLAKKRENRQKIEKYFAPFYHFGGKISNFFSSIFSKFSSFFQKPDVYKIVKITKQTVSFIVVSAVIIVVGYFLFLGISKIYDFFKVDMSWSWKFFFAGQFFVLRILLFIWAVAGAGTLLIKVLKKPCKMLANWISELDLEIPLNLKPVAKFLKFVFVAPFVFLFIKPVSFFFMYFRAVKNDHCPAIVWEEEN
jgi:hypothetical protein